MCLKKWVATALFCELIVLIISLMGVVIPIYILTRYLQQASVSARPNAPSKYNEPVIRKTDSTNPSPILIASEYDPRMASVASSHTVMMQSFHFGGFQSKQTMGYQDVNSRAQCQSDEGIIGGQQLSLAIPAALIGIIAAPEPETPSVKESTGNDKSNANSKSNLIKRIDLVVILLSMIVWISGIFFNKFVGSWAEKLKCTINGKPKED